MSHALIHCNLISFRCAFDCNDVIADQMLQLCSKLAIKIQLKTSEDNKRSETQELMLPPYKTHLLRQWQKTVGHNRKSVVEKINSATSLRPPICQRTNSHQLHSYVFFIVPVGRIC